MKETLESLLDGADLSEHEAEELLLRLSQEEPHPALVGALLSALRAKGETAAEIRGFARAMRRLARRPDLPSEPPAVDVVGTGGDGSGSYNLSTGVALLVAACGQRVVKHGNRSISSRSGSADLLECLGLDLPLDEARSRRLLEEIGFTFLYAPYYHPAMGALAPVRRALGVRTVFNVLGPLTNPAEPSYALLGAFSSEVAERMAEALSGLPIERGFVIHGTNGWDEATPIAPFIVFDVTPGKVSRTERDASEYGLEPCEPDDLRGGVAEENAKALRRVLEGEQGAHRDALLLGAALVFEVTGRARTAREGVEIAAAAIDDGRARELVESLGRFGREER